jgi:hypothetical protein
LSVIAPSPPYLTDVGHELGDEQLDLGDEVVVDPALEPLDGAPGGGRSQVVTRDVDGEGHVVRGDPLRRYSAFGQR